MQPETELISKFDQVLEQIFLLIRDIERHRWDAGVTIMVSNGAVDVRGLGTTDNPTAASALILMALKSLPMPSQQDMATELRLIMERSEVVEKESLLWRGVDVQRED